MIATLEEETQVVSQCVKSIALKPAEQYYLAAEMECLGVIWSFTKLSLSCQLQVSDTDHIVLRWIMDFDDQICWISSLNNSRRTSPQYNGYKSQPWLISCQHRFNI
ncbi:uncharacterized protein VTP21DRAFT_8136 [Calcarisporiella thermophila]|uniref:uncharacterized protein n=1 Tax=Calcarisporiella thermophila TaxID=911321 RepID=UPI003742858F